MLHAIAKKKSLRHKIYHLDKLNKLQRSEESVVRAEDEITSTILGPLDFLNFDETYKFWREIVRLKKSDDSQPILPIESPNSGSVEFWPMRSVEPDAFFKYEWCDGKCVNFLVELKWMAPISGKEQLHRQWNEFLEESQKKNSVHVFISPNAITGINAINAYSLSEQHRKQIVNLSWSQICEVLNKFEKEDGKLSRWAKLSKDFLSRVGVGVFEGFAGITSNLSESAFDYDKNSFAPFYFRKISEDVAGQTAAGFYFIEINSGACHDH